MLTREKFVEIMNLFEFKQEFDHRHDFMDHDLFLLRERHRSVIIHDTVPSAWIVVIDELLFRFRCNQIIREVGQEFGQLILIFKQTPTNYHNNIIQEYEKRIQEIDLDLVKKYELEN